MSFTRNMYDSEAYKLKMDRNNIYSSYNIFGAYAENKDQCASYSNSFGSNNSVSTVKAPLDLSRENIIDVDSMLSLRDNKLNKHNNVNTIESIKVYDKPECKYFSNEDTRFTHPVESYRELDTASYNYIPVLHIDPLKKIQLPDDKIGLNSRLYTKDTFDVEKHEFWDIGEALPKKNNFNNCK